MVLLSAPALGTAAPLAPDAGSVLREQQAPALRVPQDRVPTLRLDEPTHPRALPSSGHFVLQGFRITGNHTLPTAALEALVHDAVGHDVGLAELDTMAARISHYYRQHGYLVGRAYLPAQDIEGGIVEIAVIEGRYSHLTVANGAHLRDSIAHQHVDDLSGLPVYAPKIERKLLLLDDLAGVERTYATLGPGALVGETDATFELAPSPWVTGSVEYDNHGNHFIGADRLTGRVEVLSPLRLGDELNARFTRGFEGLDYGYVNYRLPVGGDGWRIGAGYSASDYQLGKNFAPLAANGDSNTTTLNISYPLLRTRRYSLYGDAGYAWREFQDRIDATAAVTDKRTHSATLTFSGDLRDSFGGGGVTAFSILYSNGNVNIDTPAARAIDALSARTNGHFDKWNFNFLRLQRLGEYTTLMVALSAQQAGKNLDSSEKFILGGANGIRAYPQGEASGDSGYLATTELRYRVAENWLSGVLQPFLFVDVGAVSLTEEAFVAGTNRRCLAGAGAGLTWLEAHGLQATLTLATRLGHEHAISDTDSHLRGWVQVSSRF